MAGIGFELRKYLNDDSFTGTLKAYGFAGLISAGPWVLSILGVMLIGLVALSQKVGGLEIKQFTTSVTWIMGGSLVLTGLLQLVFTRFVADRLYEGRERIINANLFGALLVTTTVSAFIGVALAFTVFHESFAYECLLLVNFVALSNIWIVVIFVAGLKQFKVILYAFGIGYSTTVLLSFVLLSYGLEGLLVGLLIGHSVLLFLMLGVVIPEYPVNEVLRKDFMQRTQIFPVLIAVGFFYNAGIWVDKLIFWLYPGTSEAVIGPLRASVIYDLPIFLAYLSIIPGMAVFLLRIETDFAEAYEGFFAAVRGNASLQEIEILGNQMVIAVREGLFQIIRVQGVTVLLLYLLGPVIIDWLGISEKYVHLYYIDLVGVAAQVLMLAMLNVSFYLDKLKDALYLCMTLFVTNGVFSWISILLGPVYYGYGFGLSMTLTTFVGIYLLSKELDNIEFRTFMKERKPMVSVSDTL
ncbi:MAG: exopolysaccharide Pel transporter PelG [Gammaproteobacteria bacterium]|nr:exopolysaccharide Pel transporter PelG [Gammaproteobacteria bacterium]